MTTAIRHELSCLQCSEVKGSGPVLSPFVPAPPVARPLLRIRPGAGGPAGTAIFQNGPAGTVSWNWPVRRNGR
jgi:hypothetical protein